MRNVLMIAGATAIAMLIQPTPASAQEGATVVKDFTCTLQPDDWANPKNLEEPLVTTEVTHFAASPNGRAIVQCLFDIPEGFEPVKAVRLTGFVCEGKDGILTTDSESISTPGGKVNLRCVFG